MNHHKISTADTKDTASGRSRRRRDADTTATTTSRVGSSNGMQPRRIRRSLPVTTSEVASFMSRKRKMSAPGEEQPSSSRPAIIVSHRNNEDEAATIPTLPATVATTAPSAIGKVTGGAVSKVNGPIATTGRPHTAPAGPTEQVKMEESEEMGGRSKTQKGVIGRNDTLRVVVPPKPTKKTTKRSRILTSADDDGIVVGGRGGRGQSAYMYACNSGGHGSSTNEMAPSYYLYHGHRHTNVVRSSSSLDSFHDCLSTSHNKEKKEDGNKVSGG